MGRARRRALVRAGAEVSGRLGFDEPLHGVLENSADCVGVGILKLAQQRLVCHPVLSHRGSPGLGRSFQENSAVAFFVYLVGRARRLTPDLHHWEDRYGTQL